MDEEVVTAILDGVESARFLYVYNATTLVSSIGAIVGTILIASFLWIAISSAFKDYYYGGGYGGSYGYRRRRSLFGHDLKAHTLLSVLMTLEEELRKRQVTSPECIEKLVCKVHLENGNDQVSSHVQQLFTIIELPVYADLPLNTKTSLKKLLEAAKRGKSGKNCSELYSSCTVESAL